MKIRKHSIELDGNELATAIDAYLAAHGIAVAGPRTIYIAADDYRTRSIVRDCAATVLVDPSGKLLTDRACRGCNEDV